MTSSPTTVLPDARAREAWNSTRPDGGQFWDELPEDLRLSINLTMVAGTQPASDAAVPAKRALDSDGLMPCPRCGGHASIVGRGAVSCFRCPETRRTRAEWNAAAPKVASDTGAGLIQADYETEADMAAPFTNHRIVPHGTISGSRLRVERAAQAIYEAGGSFCDQNGVIAWANLEGSNDAENFRKMARAALATDATATTGGDLLEQAARVADDEAEAARVLHNAAAKHRDRDGTNIHGEAWRVAKQIAAAIRALSARNQTEGGEK